jgi:small subunit ribosomal protein S20
LGREFLQLLTQKKKEEALKFFRKLASKLDTAKKKRIIHAKKASRQKSRLAKAMAKAFKS